jgi:predicted O-linked N-acetylglucosamine transferase (SPINDLY family)
MTNAFEHFIRIGNEGPVATAARIAADEIDILVDMKGYTENTRTELLALRPAPVQVNFLGYCATQGAEWIDYVIADATVLPESEYRNWTEAPVLMPHSYYPNGNDRPRPDPESNRAVYGLPEDGIVFGCMNNAFKISPESFAAFLDILKQVPGSVLCLYEGNPYVAGNLHRAALAAGVDTNRILFAKPAPLDIHLARHGCFDIFLDTIPYGAHTTAADALWMGVPLVTCTGRAWASRVGASMLNALGLPELIAADLEEFKAIAVALANDPHRRAALREKLFAARDTSPLFDAPAFARALESAYTIMATRARAGEPPAPIRIT